MTDPSLRPYLEPTWFIDSDSAAVAAFARRIVGGATDDVGRAVRLYYAVRDGIRYDPYAIGDGPEVYRASTVLGLPSAYCIQKAILLAAAARAAGIPARLGYADVRNHLTSPKLREAMGSDLFIFHGYTDLFLDGKWVKATPAFNLELCRRFGVKPLEFDGREDSIFHPFDAEGRRHMEYVADRGRFADFPFDEVMKAFAETYPGMSGRLRERAAIRDDLFRPAD